MDESIKELLLKDIRDASSPSDRALAVGTYRSYCEALLMLERWRGKE